MTLKLNGKIYVEMYTITMIKLTLGLWLNLHTLFPKGNFYHFGLFGYLYQCINVRLPGVNGGGKLNELFQDLIEFMININLLFI